MVKKRVVRFKEEHKRAFIITIIVLAVLLVLFWVKIGLYLNFLLGNDVLIKMNVDNDQFYMVNGEADDIKFEASVRTNPFCKADCSLSFMDISHNRTIDQRKFTLKTGDPFIKNYPISPRGPISGQELYSFRMECMAKQNMLCHTGEIPTRRNILITLNHELNEEQKSEKEKLRNNLEEFGSEFNQMEHLLDTVENKTKEVEQFLNIGETESKIQDANKQMEYIGEGYEELRGMWASQRFNDVAVRIEAFKSRLKESESVINNSLSEILQTFEEYNALVESIYLVHDTIKDMKRPFLTNSSHLTLINSGISHFNTALQNFNNYKDLSLKQSVVNSISFEISQKKEDMDYYERYEVIDREINTDLNYDVLCNIDSSYCYSHPSIVERATQINFDINSSCQYLSIMRDRSLTILSGLDVNESAKSQEFWSDMQDILSNRRRYFLLQYLNQTNQNHTNYDVLSQVIDIPQYIPEGNYSMSNIRKYLVWKLIDNIPEECTLLSFSYNKLAQPDVSKIQIATSEIPGQQEPLPEPRERCCVFGICHDCCTTEKCQNSEDNYPIVFVHGHAVNKDTSAEYSLDIFNNLQDWLEKDQYLGAGAINLYSEKEHYQKKWALVPVPMTMKVSYYFDVLQEEGNYQIVQTKSENIETYSIRLKEAIDIVMQKTQRPKVRIIAHSMGGLVVRRYLQLFGEGNVDKVIFVGTPHHGIEGNVADLCPVLGEKLECRDMKEGSLFMQKLQLGGLPDIPTHNIVGVGCEMEGEQGDGIVLKENVLLDNANVENYKIKGNCKGTNMLHSSMFNLDKHPELYNIIKKALET